MLLHLWLRSVFAATRFTDEIVAAPHAHRIGPPGVPFARLQLTRPRCRCPIFVPWKQARVGAFARLVGNAFTLFLPTRQMSTVDFDDGVGVKAVQDLKDDTLLSSIQVLQCGEVRSIAKFNKVLVGLWKPWAGLDRRVKAK